MKKIKNILEPLNLIYYEYDEKMNLLILDKKWPSDYTFTELIKITHALSKKHIHFFIDENKSIVIADSDTLLKKVKRFFKSIISIINNSRMNIYILSDKKVKWAKNLPVFEIEPIEQDVDLSDYDALIFTSKNAIYSIDSIDKTWRKKPAYVIAPETAKIVKHLGGSLKFVGKEKHGDEFAIEIAKKFKHQKLLYVRASKVVSNIVNILNTNDIICDELIVYKTVCKQFDEKVKLPKNSTIIFSSPSTIECFFKNIYWDESFNAISIGKTTAQYFPENIIPEISDTTSLESCVKKAIELNSQSRKINF
jgi:uroporphyrinogen-III synthase